MELLELPDDVLMLLIVKSLKFIVNKRFREIYEENKNFILRNSYYIKCNLNISENFTVIKVYENINGYDVNGHQIIRFMSYIPPIPMRTETFESYDFKICEKNHEQYFKRIIVNNYELETYVGIVDFSHCSCYDSDIYIRGYDIWFDTVKWRWIGTEKEFLGFYGVGFPGIRKDEVQLYMDKFLENNWELEKIDISKDNHDSSDDE